jgi:hypothetical protein
VVIPGGITSQLQVLDVVVNKPFTDHLKQLYSGWLLAGYHILICNRKIKTPSVGLLCLWIKMSWQQMCPEVTAKGINKCCTYDVVDAREDDVLWEDEEEGENVVGESDESGNGDSDNGKVWNNDSEGDEAGNCDNSETNW